MTADATAQPIPVIKLSKVFKTYPSGDTEIRALDDISLTIHAGEYVCIMGQSGSGKSTLLNVLGCLDRPSSGRYEVIGENTGELDGDQLAELRRRVFGFVFQRYNLLPGASALENVEMPAIYAGTSHRERIQRAQQLLARLGLGERAEHRPNQLSGGQQQRVSIARALINGAQVILADEPTGALDSRSGEDVMALFDELHAEGRTIILITHDASVAAHADRTIHLKDGRVTDDSGYRRSTNSTAKAKNSSNGQHFATELAEVTKMAFRSLRSNLFRSVLTLLGVIIGVAAVVAMLAIGDGSKKDVLDKIQAMGTNALVVRPGAPGIRGGGDIVTLTIGDADAIKELDNVIAVSPERSSRLTLRYGNRDYRSTIQGVWPSFTAARDWELERGSFITQDDVNGYVPVIVLGQTVYKSLFPSGENPVGRYVLVRSIPFEVIGTLKTKGANAFGTDMDDIGLIPLSTGLMRLFGKSYLSAITVKISDTNVIGDTETAITERLLDRHQTEDFQVRNTASLLETAAETQNTLTVLLGSVAAISLLVGGIGVMNIMLVSVSERTREIGIRMATGARASSILLQFNTEALVICGIGGMIGIAVGLATGLLVERAGMTVVFSIGPPLLAFSCAFATGLFFGYLPARRAALLDPVVALASE